jgi:predicted dehydrogenase
MVHKGMLAKRPRAFQVAAICGSSAKSRERAAAEFPNVPFVSDWHELVAMPELDAVLVLTPIHLNGKVALAALEAGKHVFVEKPVATELRDAESLLELEAVSGRRVFVLEQVAYDPLWGKAKEILQSGVLGDVVLFERINHFLMDAGEHSLSGFGATPWRIHPEYPLGAIFDGGMHDLAILSTLFGSPAGVYALGSRGRKDYGDYSELSMLFHYGHEFKGFFSFSSYLGGKRNPFTIRGTQGTLAVENCQLIVERKTGEVFQVDVPVACAHDRMYDDFIRCLESDEDPAYPLRAALADLRVLDAVTKSLKSGEKAAVAW